MGFFLSGLFRRGEATTPSGRITGGVAPSPPIPADEGRALVDA